MGLKRGLYQTLQTINKMEKMQLIWEAGGLDTTVLTNLTKYSSFSSLSEDWIIVRLFWSRGLEKAQEKQP